MAVQQRFVDSQLSAILMDTVGVKSFDEMSNMSKEKREKLNQILAIDRGTVVNDQLSEDGTRKIVVGFNGKDKVECTYRITELTKNPR